MNVVTKRVDLGGEIIDSTGRLIIGQNIATLRQRRGKREVLAERGGVVSVARQGNAATIIFDDGVRWQVTIEPGCGCR